MSRIKRTPSTLKPFVSIQPGTEKPPEDPELLEKLKEINETIQDAKMKRLDFMSTASKLQHVNHSEAQEARLSVVQVDNILAHLTALRNDLLNGKRE